MPHRWLRESPADNCRTECAPGQQREDGYKKDALRNVEDHAHRVAGVGVIPDAEGKTRRAGGRHQERQHHEGDHDEAKPGNGRPTDPLVSAAPDLIVAKQPQTLRELPWLNAPIVQAEGCDVELRPGRSYARDCETLQCTAKWAGVRVRTGDVSVARGFVPSDMVGTIAPALTIEVRYLGDDIVPDRKSIERLQHAFWRLKELGTPHVRITARLDEAGSLEPRSLAGARAAVLADMFGREGVPFERIRRRDRMTSPDASFPGAIVEIQRAAGG